MTTTTQKRVSQVKVARTAAGLSQHGLGIAANVSENRISRLETGRQPADESLRRKIADILGIKSWEVV